MCMFTFDLWTCCNLLTLKISLKFFKNAVALFICVTTVEFVAVAVAVAVVVAVAVAVAVVTHVENELC